MRKKSFCSLIVVSFLSMSIFSCSGDQQPAGPPGQQGIPLGAPGQPLQGAPGAFPGDPNQGFPPGQQGAFPGDPNQGFPPQGEFPAEGGIAPAEGELPVEGEIPVEGELPVEGEIPVEGEEVAIDGVDGLDGGLDSLDDLDSLPDAEPYSPDGSGGGGGYSLSGSFNVDQDNYVPPAIPIPIVGGLLPSRNQWRATGVTVFGSTVLVTASDSSGLVKKGTVISMDSSSGQEWKNLGSRWLGTRHAINSTVKGVTFDGNGKIYANDSKNLMYVLTEPDFSVDVIESGYSDSLDISTLGSSIIVATSGGLMKFDSTALTSGSTFAAGVSVSGGIGSDGEDNLYAISGTSIKKISADGNVEDVITDATGGIDVAVSSEGVIFVLTTEGIKMYKEGKLESTFGQSDLIEPVAIATDGSDIFVADAGSSYKDSKVHKFSTF